MIHSTSRPNLHGDRGDGRELQAKLPQTKGLRHMLCCALHILVCEHTCFKGLVLAHEFVKHSRHILIRCIKFLLLPSLLAESSKVVRVSWKEPPHYVLLGSAYLAAVQKLVDQPSHRIFFPRQAGHSLCGRGLHFKHLETPV